MATESSPTGPSSHPRSYTPHAILVGSVVIAAGLYFGLRRDAVPPPAPSANPTGTAAASVAPTNSAAVIPTTSPLDSSPPASPPPASSARPQTAIDADVAKAIAALAQRTSKECYAPLKGQPGTPAKVKFVYSGSFDPTGKEVARGISEDREANSPMVAACLRAFKMDLEIPAPGQYVNVNVPFEVP